MTNTREGSPPLRNPPFPALALYFQEYLIIGALASAAHSWMKIHAEGRFTDWGMRPSRATMGIFAIPKKDSGGRVSTLSIYWMTMC
jgi:hypothetical protein